MAETIRVPIEGGAVVNQSAVTPQAEPGVQERPDSGFVNGQYVPPAKRVTLHNTRLGVEMHARQAEAKAPAPAPPPQPSQADAGRLNTLEAAITALAASQLNNMQRGYETPDSRMGTLDRLIEHTQRGGGYIPEDGGGYSQQSDSPDYGGAPDPNNYELWDDYGRAQYKRDLDAYVKEVATRGIEAHTATQRGEAFKEDIARECEAVRAKFGRDANYDEAANAAKLIHLNAGGELTIEQAYLQASNELEANSPRRGRASYYPPDVKTLGAMAEYNNRTGRAKPFPQKRGW